MTSSIATVVAGTYLPYNRELVKEIDSIYRAWLGIDRGTPYTNSEHCDWVSNEPWTHLYHGSISPVAYVGHPLCVFDSTENQEARSIRLVPTEEEWRKARKLYDALLYAIRSFLPPLSVYLVWSTS